MSSAKSRFATHRIAEAIADEQPVDWTPAERALGTDAAELESLRVLDDVARAFRRSSHQLTTRRGADPAFRWNGLDVHERLGEGHSGEVYRAYDPALQRDVALKLRARRDPLSDPANRQLLNEARQLARIRHHNVLAVYGADVDDGRAGIWSELIQGETLAQVVAHSGPLSPAETLAIGLDLCRALAVVHGAGLLHGDVKAENVMRERGGRIVLMDFGASGLADEAGARAVWSGTRRYLPPELLAGEHPPSPAADLYATGVLLYLLLTGRFPRDRDDSPVVALAERRPDLPHALSALIDAAIADDPRKRPRTAGQLANALLAMNPAEPASRRRLLVLAVAVGAALMLASAALLRDVIWPAPWRVEAQFHQPATEQVLVDGTPVRLGDPLVLRLSLSRPGHVYVLNEDAEGELTVLFPLPGLEQGNPVPAGEAIELPGRSAGRPMRWQISSPSASEEFVVIVSAQPLDALARRLAGNTHAQFGSAAHRGAGALQAAPTQAVTIEGQALAELVAVARASVSDPADLHVQVLRLPHSP